LLRPARCEAGWLLRPACDGSLLNPAESAVCFAPPAAEVCFAPQSRRFASPRLRRKFSSPRRVGGLLRPACGGARNDRGALIKNKGEGGLGQQRCPKPPSPTFSARRPVIARSPDVVGTTKQPPTILSLPTPAFNKFVNRTS